MAAIALRSEGTAMYIIIVMASDAGARHNHAVAHRLLVARIAIQFFVSTVQLETGASVVIEIPYFP